MRTAHDLGRLPPWWIDDLYQPVSRRGVLLAAEPHLVLVCDPGVDQAQHPVGLPPFVGLFRRQCKRFFLGHGCISYLMRVMLLFCFSHIGRLT
jgi:hypothetical protein